MRVFFRNSLCGIYVQHSQISGHMQENAEKSLLRAGFHQRRVGLILDFAARIEDKSGPGAVGREDNPVILFGDGDALAGISGSFQGRFLCMIIVSYI